MKSPSLPYVDIANTITTAMHKTMNETVIDKFKAMEQVQYRGVKYAELGDKSESVRKRI